MANFVKNNIARNETKCRGPGRNEIRDILHSSLLGVYELHKAKAMMNAVLIISMYLKHLSHSVAACTPRDTCLAKRSLKLFSLASHVRTM